MTGGEEEQKKGESKGFAGLSSLVSDVDTTPPPAKKEPAAAAQRAERSAPPPAQPQPQPQPSQRQTYQAPAQPSSGSSGGKWLLGIAAVIGVLLWLSSQSDKTATTSPAPAYSPPAQSTAPSYSPPAQPQVPSRPTESQPPVGQNLVFSREQIRYCLAEDIRMDGAKAAINNYIESDVERFNAMVADYNSRCGSFRYRSGALEGARRDMEPYRSQLQTEGRGRFSRGTAISTQSVDFPAAARPTSDASDVHSMLLNSLRLRPGTAERLVDSGKMIVALANSGYVSLKPDARIDYSDYRFFKKPAHIFGQELMVISEEYFKEWVGCCVSPGIAITVKLNGNIDALQEFASNNKCRVGLDGDLYYGPTLPYAPKGTYSTLSCKERDVQ